MRFLAVIFMAVFVCGCDKKRDEPAAASSENAAKPSIVGRWILVRDGKDRPEGVEFRADGTAIAFERDGQAEKKAKYHWIDDKRLQLDPEEEKSSDRQPIVFTVVLSGDDLVLDGDGKMNRFRRSIGTPPASQGRPGRVVKSKWGIRYCIPDGWSGGDRETAGTDGAAVISSPAKDAKGSCASKSGFAGPEEFYADLRRTLEKCEVKEHSKRVEKSLLIVELSYLFLGRRLHSLMRVVEWGKQTWYLEFSCTDEKFEQYREVFEEASALFEAPAR